MDEIDELLFSQMIADDGRHKKLFILLRSGEITEAEFESREAQILEELAAKLHCRVCQREQSQH